jgi:hypothetical protein
MLSFLLPLSAQAQGFTVADLVHDCKVCSEAEDAAECVWCNGVITGTVTSLNMLEGGERFCPPQNMDTHAARNLFRRFALRNKEWEEENAVAGLLESLLTTYDCKK